MRKQKTKEIKNKEISEEEKKKIRKKNLIMDLIISTVVLSSLCIVIYLREIGVFTPEEVKELEGSYRLIQMIEHDKVTDKTEFGRLDDMILEIKKNGTGKLNLYGEEADLTIDKENIKYGNDIVSYKAQDNKITFAQNGIYLVFEKEM